MIQCPCEKCGKPFWREDTEKWKVVCLQCWIDSRCDKPKDAPRANPKAAPAPAIEPVMLRRLIQLCHPDRHGGSVAASVATEWLLKQRARK